MRDRIEQCGFQRVSLASHFGSRRLGGEAVSHHRLAQLVRGGGKEPRVRAARQRIAVDAGRPHRADDFATRRYRDAEDGHRIVPILGMRAVARHSPRRSLRIFALLRRRGLAHSRPARLCLRRARVEHPARSDRRSRLAGPAVGHDAFFWEGCAHADPDTGHFGLADESRRDERRRFQRRRGVRRIAAHGEHHLALHRRSRVVQVDDGAAGALERLDGAADQVLARPMAMATTRKRSKSSHSSADAIEKV